MISSTEIVKTAEEWTETTKSLLQAVANRNFQDFRKFFAMGCKHFKQVRNFMGQNVKISEQDIKLIHKVAKDWQETTSSIDVWKEEIRTELEGVKRKKKVQSKINKAYRFSSNATTGLNVKRKVK